MQGINVIHEAVGQILHSAPISISKKLFILIEEK